MQFQSITLVFESKNDVVSQPVRAWKEGRPESKPSGRFSLYLRVCDMMLGKKSLDNGILIRRPLPGICLQNL